ncbi:MAG: EamA family transporter RarD [Deltaproteobacteria bacterium]|jgi:chloramphenicol-sensitive protein RarD|nr:EamA family transporter RarD [Deltaproteobacteria bacterium]
MLNKTFPATRGPDGPVSPVFTGEGELRKGIAAVLAVNIIWALLPIYWKQITHVSPLEILSHRSLWGFLLVALLLGARGGFSEVRDIVRNKRTLMFMTGCSLSHMFGWGVYIWAVGSGHIIDAALGNYMLPMWSVLCGFLVFRERPRRIQWLAIALAAFGVIGMILWYGTLPWVGLVISMNAVFFATMRKNAPVNAMPGLIIELLITAPLLWGYLAYLVISGNGVFSAMGFTQDLWLIGAGIVTIIPQMGYAYGLCRVPLTTISLMQYLPPTGNFLVGLFLFNEAFTPDKVFGAVFIWSGLLVFTLEGIHVLRKTRRTIDPKRRSPEA